MHHRQTQLLTNLLHFTRLVYLAIHSATKYQLRRSTIYFRYRIRRIKRPSWLDLFHPIMFHMSYVIPLFSNLHHLIKSECYCVVVLRSLRRCLKGKLLIQSLEWLFHNFSETHHFTDHLKDNRENPFCNMWTLLNKTYNRIQNKILTLEAAMLMFFEKLVFSKKLFDS